MTYFALEGEWEGEKRHLRTVLVPRSLPATKYGAGSSWRVGTIITVPKDKIDIIRVGGRHQANGIM